jgi:hypothetical protein
VALDGLPTIRLLTKNNLRIIVFPKYHVTNYFLKLFYSKQVYSRKGGIRSNGKPIYENLLPKFLKISRH